MKRHDATWDDYQEYVEIDTLGEWKKVSRRNCVPARHRGIKYCVADEIKVLEWLIFLHLEMFHDEAITNCDTLDADLFFKLIGTFEQLMFFYNRLNSPFCYWLGVWKAGNPPKWQTITGIDMLDDVMLWAPSQPDNHSGNEAYRKQRNWFKKQKNQFDAEVEICQGVLRFDITCELVTMEICAVAISFAKRKLVQ